MPGLMNVSRNLCALFPYVLSDLSAVEKGLLYVCIETVDISQHSPSLENQQGQEKTTAYIVEKEAQNKTNFNLHLTTNTLV